MPELPEVETTARGIEPHVLNNTVSDVIIRDGRLRWPVPPDLARHIVGQTVKKVWRRAKYLLLNVGGGSVIVHLGMSGSLRVLSKNAPLRPHDHVELVFADDACLRLHDPRRFGCVLWVEGDANQHPRLASLGIEPLSDQFNGAYLYRLACGRKTAVKKFIMDSRIVVGVGNIYANEALFLSGVHPVRAAGRVGLQRYERICAAIKQTLREAIVAGGTTLRDFYNSAGDPGYFALALNVYGREREPCPHCGAGIRRKVIGQRSTFYCPRCQI
jgi:formamidopyrimidine-DNA glycosylase